MKQGGTGADDVEVVPKPVVKVETVAEPSAAVVDSGNGDERGPRPEGETDEGTAEAEHQAKIRDRHRYINAYQAGWKHALDWHHRGKPRSMLTKINEDGQCGVEFMKWWAAGEPEVP